MILINRRTI